MRLLLVYVRISRPWNYKRTGITYKKIPLEKLLEFDMPLK